jgi:4-amino-4-deoxy-L-arabinose transferase-like glycosyltransferase
VFFSFPQSKLPGYCLPAFPGVALGTGLFFAYASRDEAIRTAAARSSRIAAAIMLALAAVLAAGTGVIGRVPGLATSVREAIPGFAFAIAVVLAVAAALAAWGARRRSVWVTAAALALPVAAAPFAGASLLKVVGRDRSSLDLATAIERVAPRARIVAVATYPTSLRYYVDRPVLLTTATGEEMTSHYIASRIAEFRDLPDSPLRPADWWRTVLDACDEPTVFIVRDDAPEAAMLAARLRRVASGGAAGRYVAYGPCAVRPAEAAR